jgi:uncharacterized membrane protein HdeD (DUF308 family)
MIACVLLPIYILLTQNVGLGVFPIIFIFLITFIYYVILNYLVSIRIKKQEDKPNILLFILLNFLPFLFHFHLLGII